MPKETLLTIKVEDQSVPALFAHLVKDGKVMSHPEIHQYRYIPPARMDSNLKMMVQTDAKMSEVLDPNAELTHSHVLAPLAIRAAALEQAMSSEPLTVSVQVLKPNFTNPKNPYIYIYVFVSNKNFPSSRTIESSFSRPK